MIEPKILCKGSLSSEKINVNFNPVSNRKVDQKLEGKSKRAWKNVYDDAKRQGKKIWDSEIYRLNNWSRTKRGLDLEISTMPFSIRTGLKLQDLETYGKDYYPRLLFVSSIIRTSDNFYVFGIRSGKYINTYIVDLIGGVLSKSEKDIDSGQDIENHLMSEIEEETGIRIIDIQESKFIGMILTSNYGIALQYKTELNLSKEAVENNFKNKKDDELKDLKFIPEKHLESFLGEQDSYRKLIYQLL